MAKESKVKKLQTGLLEFLEEKGIVRADGAEPSRLHKFGHFWLLVAKSFSKNKCPVRASALAYGSLLALIPMLAVAISVSTSILKKDGEDRILEMVNKLVDSVVPPAMLSSTNGSVEVVNARVKKSHGQPNVAAAKANSGEVSNPVVAGTNEMALTNGVPGAEGLAGVTNQPAGETNTAAAGVPGAKPVDARKQVAKQINEFIQNTRTGTLGLTGSVLLVFVAISMLSRIEEAFNDIWGVTRGRSWLSRIVQYWAVITLGPIFLALALGLSSGPQLLATKRFLEQMPVASGLLFKLLPVVVLCLSFGLFYMLMPNTKVSWKAAVVGGTVGGILWHFNNMFSVYYVSRVVTNSRFYGSLGMVPVFMVGLYFSWLILLFGAQVAYAYQNRVLYLQQKLSETICQRGREFLALRLIQCVAERFQKGQLPPTVPEMAARLIVPTRMVQQIMQTLVSSHLVVEVVLGKEIGFAAARPLDSMTCHDILLALRVGQGQELATRDEPARSEIYDEYEKILEAERRAASSVTILELTTRAEALKIAGNDLKAVTHSTT
ncbi:YhjD/YihY/BrkB family envelope integrity protein [Pedosphaera parvula]|uniref:Ribonuclease BN n=1 Tax=Pedosphaera parvula (strain Ellin514) TaxID=320771 RepID=B9XR08_PEDPL|nr:YhjD/YihY/BrkB family envelope integrity protein [Pedosphaera parvula]EEF57704.1 ribonuclease BN [Pedosphaera parvula Ellin514]